MKATDQAMGDPGSLALPLMCRVMLDKPHHLPYGHLLLHSTGFPCPDPWCFEERTPFLSHVNEGFTPGKFSPNSLQIALGWSVKGKQAIAGRFTFAVPLEASEGWIRWETSACTSLRTTGSAALWLLLQQPLWQWPACPDRRAVGLRLPALGLSELNALPILFLKSLKKQLVSILCSLLILW